MMATRNGWQDPTTLWSPAARWLALVVAIPAACGLVAGPARAQEFLACGVPVSRHLESGNQDRFQPAVSGDLQRVFDATDTSGTIGLLQLTALDTCIGTSPPVHCLETCNGSLAFIATLLGVSDCIGDETGDYTVEFNVVQQSPENCGVPLSCGVTPADTALSVPGEVDPYTFAGIAGQQITLTTTPMSDTIGSLRMRLYSPKGELQSDSCTSTLAFDVPSTGTYTVLVSACVEPSTGPYTIVWQTVPVCPVAAVPAFAYVTYSGSRTVAVVDLANNQTVSIIPDPTARPPGDGFSSITKSPNDGFAYVTFGGSPTISVINTTLNREVGFITVPSDDIVRIAVGPEGRYAYAVGSTFGGVVVLNIAARKIDGIIPLPGLFPYSDGSAIAVSPDGKSLYVPAHFVHDPGPPEQSEAGMVVIDLATRTVVGSIIDPRFNSQLLDISFNSAGTLAYVLTLQALYVVDTKTESITQSLPLNVSDIAYSADGRVGYAVGCPGEMLGGCPDPPADLALLVIDIATLTITNTVPLKAALHGYSSDIALSPDGGRLVVTNSYAEANRDLPAALVIDTATLQAVATIPAVGDEPFDVAIVTPPSGLCTGDDSGQTRVTVGELVSSVDYAVDGCPTAVRSHGGISP